MSSALAGFVAVNLRTLLSLILGLSLLAAACGSDDADSTAPADSSVAETTDDGAAADDSDAAPVSADAGFRAPTNGGGEHLPPLDPAPQACGAAQARIWPNLAKAITSEAADFGTLVMGG